MSAYGNLAGARTNIGRSLSNITGLGIEMEYGPEGRISGEMAQSRIQRFTEAIGLGLESVQQIAGLGLSAQKEAARAKEMGTLAGTGAKQTVGETKLWDLFRGKADIGPGETFLGEVGERIGTGLGFTDREYEMGGRRYTSSQIEAGLPYAKLGKDWEDVSKLMGGGTEGTYKSLESGGTTTYSSPIAKYADWTEQDIWSEYQKGGIEEDVFKRILATGKYPGMGSGSEHVKPMIFE